MKLNSLRHLFQLTAELRLTSFIPRLRRSFAVKWSQQWEPSRAGDHQILAFATGGTGILQSTLEHKPFPDGASGIHEVIVAVL